MTAPAIFLDSGAFSSWRKGASIDLDAYIAFIRRHEALLHAYVNLDVIPGQDGKREDQPERIEQAAARSYQNQQRMKDAGLRPIAVFHQDEEFEWLERYLADGEPYIALSPYLKAHRHEIIGWLDRCFAVLTAKGRPLVKVHALGVTAPLILRRYSWTTVDSSTWVKRAGFGQVPIPRYTDGKPNYALDPTFLSVTDPSLYRSRRHVGTIHDFHLDRVHQYLNEEVGIDLAYARYSFPHRCRVWIAYHNGLGAYCGAEIISVAGNAQQAHMLAQAQVRRRLVSYYYLKDLPDPALADFLAGQAHLRKESKPPKSDWHSDAYIRWRALALLEHARRGIERADDADVRITGSKGDT
jgi:hypothetical protein